MPATISRDELKGKMDRGEEFVLVEALPEEYFRKEHLPGAINLPTSQVDAEAENRIPDKNADIVVYCAGPHCDAAEQTARLLEAKGYAHVRDYKGGKKEWAESGLPLV